MSAIAARFGRREPGTGDVADFDTLMLPPHNVEAEQAVLGGALIDNRAWPRVRDLLAVGDFYRADHRTIYRTVAQLMHEDEPADVLTVADALRAAGELEGAGGLVYLQSLASGTPSAANVAHYAGIVARLARQRELGGTFETLRIAALAPGANVDALRADAEAMLAGIQHSAPLQPLNLATLAGLDPTPPQNLMPGLPTGYATLLAGHGGAGKSQIALMLAVCLAAGRFFFGLDTQRRRVLFLSCEDRADVLHWRLSRICAWLGIDLASLAGWLEIVDLVGKDSILWRADPRNGNGVTPAFHQVAQLMRASDREVLFVDGVSDTFGGSENDRSHVKQFVNALLALIPAVRGALVLIGHVAKTAAGGFSTEGYSGSTGWHNAVRARWYLRHETRPSEEGERTERTGALLLELQKANHGDELQMRFEWDEGAHLFTGEVVGGASRFDRKHQERTELAGILAAFKACATASPPINIPAAQSGNRTGFHVVSIRPEFPPTLRDGKAGTRRFWRHVEELRQMRALTECSIRRSNRHLLACLEITPEGLRQCAESG